MMDREASTPGTVPPYGGEHVVHPGWTDHRYLFATLISLLLVAAFIWCANWLDKRILKAKGK